MPVRKKPSGTSASSMACAPAGDDGEWEWWNSKWDSAATSSTQKSRGWKSSPQKTGKSSKEAEWSVDDSSKWEDWHHDRDWQQHSRSWSTWNSGKKDPGLPGSPNEDSNWEVVRGDGEDDELEDAAPHMLESKQVFDGCLSVPPLTPLPLMGGSHPPPPLKPCPCLHSCCPSHPSPTPAMCVILKKSRPTSGVLDFHFVPRCQARQPANQAKPSQAEPTSHAPQFPLEELSFSFVAIQPSVSPPPGHPLPPTDRYLSIMGLDSSSNMRRMMGCNQTRLMIVLVMVMPLRTC